jgi:hypothetical protein
MLHNLIPITTATRPQPRRNPFPRVTLQKLLLSLSSHLIKNNKKWRKRAISVGAIILGRPYASRPNATALTNPRVQTTHGAARIKPSCAAHPNRYGHWPRGPTCQQSRHLGPFRRRAFSPSRGFLVTKAAPILPTAPRTQINPISLFPGRLPSPSLDQYTIQLLTPGVGLQSLP